MYPKMKPAHARRSTYTKSDATVYEGRVSIRERFLLILRLSPMVCDST